MFIYELLLKLAHYYEENNRPADNVRDGLNILVQISSKFDKTLRVKPML